jgi:heme O synthase-like polyprenyltransferase
MNVSVAEIEEPRVIGVRERIAAFVELTKAAHCAHARSDLGAGFYLGTTGSFEFVTFFNAVTGIALLAFGVATLNQYLERRTDLLMDRTA